MSVIAENLLSSYVDEVVSLSDLPPKAVSHLRETLTDYLLSELIDHGDYYPILINELYGFNDNQRYSLLALSSSDVDYYLFLFSQTTLNMAQFRRDYILWLKNNFVFNNGIDISIMVGKATSIFRFFHELNDNCIKTSRTATGCGDKPISFPSEEKLQRFYECERKKQYDTLEETFVLDDGKEPYLCGYCAKYHKGSPKTGMKVPHEIMLSRWKTVYRRTLKI